MRQIHWLAAITMGDAPAVGQKAAVLGEMLTRGFRVPPGFVLGVGSQAVTEADLDAVVTVAEKLTDKPLAVRSSAVAEDLPDRSYAGLYETVLNVSGPQALRAAVRKCLASADSERVSAYATNGPMAVLVQEMVPADAAGVAFTANPVTNATDETSINAVLGLADDLASGKADPEQWTIASAAPWPHRISGPLDVLSEDQASEIGNLAGKVAQRLGGPVDIEWAYAGGQLFLLQARPITGLVQQVPIPVEIPPGFWIRDSAHGPRPRTPMTVSVFQEEPALAAAFAEYGALVRPKMAEIGGWHYRSFYPLSGNPDASPPPGWLLSILVRVIPAFRGKLRRTREYLRGREAEELVARWSGELRPALEKRIDRLRDDGLGALDDTAVLNRLDDLQGLVAEGLRLHMRLAVPHGKGIAELHFACRDLLGWRWQETEQLLVGLSERSTAPARALAAVTALGPDSPKFAAALANYRRTYGCRAIGYEVAEPTLGELSGLIDRLISEATANGETDSAPRTTRRDKSAARARAALRDDDLRQFLAALAQAEIAYGVREDNAFFTVGVPLGLLRFGLLEAGRRLVDRGLLTSVDDIFFVSLEEACAALANSIDLRTDVTKNRGRYVWALAHPGPPTYGKNPGPPPKLRWLPAPTRHMMACVEWTIEQIFAPELSTRTTVDGASLTGVAASAGRYRGPVRVIETEAQFGKLRPGDVLVCPATNPSWSVLFASISALVTESGGALSHPAIIAREFGIPAVVATGCATSVLRDGQIVTVDGSLGVVELES
ncbi:PEP/pyruvate-binding domain-containing protein [Fodinicola feengrottensis]|uniref:PEP/pyruvate-binding domain-containing protein n=1 Tax=Fodinicola feengrottensis TaxID=435914 RepID=A0ABN2HC81_9ACTN